MNKCLLLSLVGGLSWAMPLSAQKMVRENIRIGNDQYEKSEFLESELSYRKALEGNPADSLAKFNLGNTLFRQQKMDDAMEQYLAVASAAEHGDAAGLSAQAYFNAGDVCMAKQDYARAEELFKQSLRMNPDDDEARYNMLLAQRLRRQQEQEQQDQQNQDQNQDKDQQNQDQQQQQKDQQQQQQDQKDQQQEQQQNQQQQEQNQDQQQQQQQQQQANPKMSEEQAEAILNAANQEERDVQERVQERLMQQVERKRTDKDW